MSTKERIIPESNKGVRREIQGESIKGAGRGVGMYIKRDGKQEGKADGDLHSRCHCVFVMVCLDVD